MKYKSSINSHLGIKNLTFSNPELCYEATQTFARALHNTSLGKVFQNYLRYVVHCISTFADIETDTALNMEAGRQAGLSEGEKFTLANFSYSNSVIVQRMFHHLSSTDFIGITVSIFLLTLSSLIIQTIIIVLHNTLCQHGLGKEYQF